MIVKTEMVKIQNNSLNSNNLAMMEKKSLLSEYYARALDINILNIYVPMPYKNYQWLLSKLYLKKVVKFVMTLV